MTVTLGMFSAPRGPLAATPGPRPAGAGLTGGRYLLLIGLLVLLSSAPMLLLVVAGTGAAGEHPPVPPPAEASPFITYVPVFPAPEILPPEGSESGPGW